VSDWIALCKDVAERCRVKGLDLVHPFSLGWYNDLVEHEAHKLPDHGRRHALGLLIGNTKSFWPMFSRALRRDAELARSADPVDRYIVESIDSALAGLAEQHTVRFGHDLEPCALPIQRLAAAAGLAHLSPSHLSIHPVHGPWIALRALVVLDVDGPDGPRVPAPDPCVACAKPCLDALSRALEVTALPEGMQQKWEAWLAVRDACPQGTASRYSDEQVRYHYTKLRRLLPVL
jgi:methylmalonic aciduria homocystinuria type C protein